MACLLPILASESGGTRLWVFGGERQTRMWASWRQEDHPRRIPIWVVKKGAIPREFDRVEGSQASWQPIRISKALLERYRWIGKMERWQCIDTEAWLLSIGESLLVVTVCREHWRGRLEAMRIGKDRCRTHYLYQMPRSGPGGSFWERKP